MKRLTVTELLPEGRSRRLIDPGALHPTRRDTSNRSAAGTLCHHERAILLMMWQHRCAYCGGTLTVARMQLDHLTPVSRGGVTELGNCVPACSSCNESKGPLTAEEYGRPDIRERARWRVRVVAAYWRGMPGAIRWMHSAGVPRYCFCVRFNAVRSLIGPEALRVAGGGRAGA